MKIILVIFFITYLRGYPALPEDLSPKALHIYLKGLLRQASPSTKKLADKMFAVLAYEYEQIVHYIDARYQTVYSSYERVQREHAKESTDERKKELTGYLGYLSQIVQELQTLKSMNLKVLKIFSKRTIGYIDKLSEEDKSHLPRDSLLTSSMKNLRILYQLVRRVLYHLTENISHYIGIILDEENTSNPNEVAAVLEKGQNQLRRFLKTFKERFIEIAP